MDTTFPGDSTEVLEKNGQPLLGSKKQALAVPSAERSVRALKAGKTIGTTPPIRASTGSLPGRKKADNAGSSDLSSRGSKTTTTTTKPTINSNVTTPVSRNNIGGALEKQMAARRISNGTDRPAGVKKISPTTDTNKLTSSGVKRTTLPSSLGTRGASLEVKKAPQISDRRSTDSVRKPSIKPSLSVSTSMKSPSTLSSSSDRGSFRRASSGLSSSSIRTPSSSSSLKSGSLSSSADKGSTLSSRKKPSTPDSRDSRLIILPQVEVKAGDDLRLDLRGHRVRSLTARGLNLSPNLEFMYLRDNLLSSLDGIEILTRVKVLDLSFNNFKGTDFEPLENCKALQQLYLAGNQITSLASLPELPNLEFLSVAQNKLKSLYMASQPRLQVLAASKNKINTLKGFPHFPVMEHLRVEENPVLELPHLEAASVLLVGPTLKKFNDRDLSPEEVEISKCYPAHTPLCIRDGWELSLPEDSAESTFHFLVEKWKDHLPPGCTLMEASVDKPFEGDICHCQFNFSNDHLVNKDSLILRYQWLIGGTTPTNFVMVDGAVSKYFWPTQNDVGKCLKVECTPILEGVEYPSVFAVSPPVCAGTGRPKVLSLTVHGKLVEGNIIKGVAEIAWCGGTAGKCVTSWLRRKWNGSPVVITGAEDEEYQLMVDDIDSSLVFMYTPVTQEGFKGEPQYAMTDFVKAAPPSVNNVQILGDAIEGGVIKGLGKYFGGREGPSKFEWSRENKETGDRLVVSVGSNEYNLTKEDVGWRIAFSYIPINFEGQEGGPVYCVTDIIRRAPPKVNKLKIIGDLREGSKVTVSAAVTGGTEGSSRVQWFKTSFTCFEGDEGLEPLSASKIAKAFRIPVGAVGYYLVAKFIPMAPDGEAGVAAYVASEATVETLPPSLNFLAVTGDYCEGEVLTASYGYIGGHEGKSLYSWYLHEGQTDISALVPIESGSVQYRISKIDIGKFVSFKCTPIRDDGTVGEPRICTSQECVRPGSPRLISLRIVGECVEGNTLFADRNYWGGNEGNSLFQWFSIGDDGVPIEIKGATTASYVLSIKDIGHKISVSCEPIRCDGARGATVISEEIGPTSAGLPTCKTLEFAGSMVEGTRLTFIADYVGGEKGNCTQEWYRVRSSGLKEILSNNDYLDLSLKDVGKRIELVYTPIRGDGFKGSPKGVVSSVIAPAEPMGVELIVPKCCEDQKILPKKAYYGGEEGNGEYVWYRTAIKLEMPILDNISNCEGVIVVGKSLIYTPSLEDVGSFLALRWVPIRSDGKSGESLMAVCDSPVSPAPPSVSNVHIREKSFGIYTGEGKYYGGHEGSSLYSWYRESNDGIALIDGANSISYEVTDSDYNCRLLFGYTPVRSDSVVGDLCLSDPSSIVLPALPQIELLSFVGKAIEGEKLTAKEIMPDSEAQRKVWNNYKREVKFQWFHSEVEDTQSFESVNSQHSCSYKLRLEDVGRCLKCDCIITDIFGRSSNVATALSSPILPGIPRIDKLEIEGRGFHTNLYAVRGIYSGGIEGKSKIQWLRSMVGSPDLISIPGETGRMYEANVDDVGYRLVALYTPVREDGIEGQPVSVSTEPIAVEPDVYREVKQQVDLGSVKFEVLCDKDQSQKKVPGVGNLERRILEVNRKRIKVIKPGSKTSFPATEIRGTYAPPFHVELFRNDQHRFRIVVDSNDEVDLMVQTRHMRDVIVLVVRGLAQKFNSTSLNSLLQIGT